MKVVQQLADVQKTPGPVILAAGTFDGIHKGHQAVIQRAVEKASAVKGSAWVLTLDPHPLKILHPARAPKLLTSTSHKLQLIEPLGIQGCLVLPFTPERAAQEPEAFVADLAAGIPGLQGMVVGENWTFGRRARGTPDLLQQLAEQHGFKVTLVPPVTWQGEPVSSTRIRKAVFEARLDEASALLGRHFSILGDVIPGRQVGRTLGFPTANVDPHNEVQPPPGVYAASLVHQGRRYNGAAFRPDPAQMGPLPEDITEIHLFDFEGDLYGQTVELSFISRLRPPQQFKDLESLRLQIAADVQALKAFFSSIRPPASMRGVL